MIPDYFLDFLFPKFCLECGREGDWWCGLCLVKNPALLHCSRPVNYGQDSNFLDGILAFFNYQKDGIVAQLVQQFKYSRAWEIKKIWQKVISEQAANLATYIDFELVPVPLYPQRERERGFNQAKILAELVANLFLKDNGVNENLKRLRNTPHQAELTRHQRLVNLDNAFSWVWNEAAPARVLLIDDVYTTGTTMNECAKVLKQAGAKLVFGLCLAKGE